MRLSFAWLVSLAGLPYKLYDSAAMCNGMLRNESGEARCIAVVEPHTLSKYLFVRFHSPYREILVIDSVIRQ